MASETVDTQKGVSRAHLGHGSLYIVTGNASLGDLLSEVNDEKFWEKSTPNCFDEAFQSLVNFKCSKKKWSNVSMLQKLAHRNHGLHERETLEVTHSDVDATKLAYNGRQGTNDTNWLPSKIVVNLGRVEVLKTAPRGNSPKCRNSASRDAS